MLVRAEKSGRRRWSKANGPIRPRAPSIWRPFIGRSLHPRARDLGACPILSEERGPLCTDGQEREISPGERHPPAVLVYRIRQARPKVGDRVRSVRGLSQVRAKIGSQANVDVSNCVRASALRRSRRSRAPVEQRSSNARLTWPARITLTNSPKSRLLRQS
jgi:hypothetical protein